MKSVYDAGCDTIVNTPWQADAVDNFGQHFGVGLLTFKHVCDTLWAGSCCKSTTGWPWKRPSQLLLQSSLIHCHTYTLQRHRVLDRSPCFSLSVCEGCCSVQWRCSV